MREELFDDEEENEEYDYFGEIVCSKRLKKLNPNISNDLETLQNHYSIMLDYVLELEDRVDRYKEQVEILSRKLNYFEYVGLNETDRDRKIKKLEKELEDLNLLLFDNIR